MMDVLQTPWKQAIEIETRVAQIIYQQEQYGFFFDIQLARKHLDSLSSTIKSIDDNLAPRIPWRKRVPTNFEVPRPFKKDGELLERIVRYFDGFGIHPVGPFSKVYYEPINLESDDQIKEYLLSVGWKPTEYNYDKKTKERTSPKLTEDSYESIPDGVGAAITERLVLSHRYGQLAGLIESVRVDGRIPSRINTLGTNTGRVRHSVIVNLPRITTPFGKEIRECFTVPEGKVLLGCDAVSLESRIMAHYLNDVAMTELILSGNFITSVYEAITEYASIRDVAKTIWYALLYGASEDKLGRIADKRPPGWSNKAVGEAIKATLYARMPALGKLMTGIKTASKRGYLYGIDGRRLYIRSEHSAPNTLFQSAGAIAMKKALVIADDLIKSEKLDCHQVTFQHDETQDEVIPEHSERAGRVRCYAIEESGKHFKLNCPLAGEAKVASNWSLNH